MRRYRVWAGEEVYLKDCQYSGSAWFRMKGLLGRSSLPVDEGILLKPGNQIHMFFMKFAIDAVFLDRDDVVVHICHSIRPWQVSAMYLAANAVLETSAGLAKSRGLEVGGRLRFEELAD